MEVFSIHIVTSLIRLIVYSNVIQYLTSWLYKHFTVLCQHVLSFVLDPVRIVISRFGTRNICFCSLLISIIVALPFVVVSIAVLDADIELTVFLVGTIYITDITSTEDVTVIACQLLGCTYRTAVYVYLCMSEDVTVGVECTPVTEVVVASTATEYVTVNLALEEFYGGPTSLIDTLQGTVAVVNTCRHDDTTSYGSNLTTSEECVTYYAAVHLYVCYIHTTVVDISATEYTSTIIESVSAVARPSLVV